MKYLANLISILRIVAAVPVFFLLYYEMNTIAVYLIIIAFISDFFDGYFARLFKATSELGKILDPVADKILLAAIGLALFVNGSIPLWFIIVFILRDLFILIGSYYTRRKTQFVLPSNYTGKITYAVMAVVITGIIFNLKYFDTWGLYISAFFIGLSFMLYLIRFIKFIKREK